MTHGSSLAGPKVYIFLEPDSFFGFQGAWKGSADAIKTLVLAPSPDIHPRNQPGHRASKGMDEVLARNSAE